MERMNISVLILEDDRELAECTADYLRSYGLKAKFAADVQEFEEAREKETFDILLLDIMLGGTSGLALCHKIRETSDIPIIFLTALGEEADIVLGLEMGADDYLVKPFSCRELLARINRIMRRVRKDKAQALPPELALNIPEPEGRFLFGDWALDTKAHLLLDREGVAYNLSHSQYVILLFLLRHPHEVVERDTLLDLLESGGAGESSQHRLDAHISRLRGVLGDNDVEKTYIRTVRNVGYMFIADCMER